MHVTLAGCGWSADPYLTLASFRPFAVALQQSRPSCTILLSFKAQRSIEPNLKMTPGGWTPASWKSKKAAQVRLTMTIFGASPT
jgi:hypothetical protein